MIVRMYNGEDIGTALVESIPKRKVVEYRTQVNMFDTKNTEPEIKKDNGEEKEKINGEDEEGL